MLHCRLSLQRRGLICPWVSCFTLKITTPSIFKEEKDLFRLGETTPLPPSTSPLKKKIHNPTPVFGPFSLF